ncbi:MAG: hypothetical protein KDD34_08035 [Bdellovibrionales bacterium]|nr:hypothetical protein [Bdellovibrionales bacterium]
MDEPEVEFCQSKSYGCKKVDMDDAEKLLKSKVGKDSGYAGRKVLRFLTRNSSKNKQSLLAYLALMDWDKKIQVKSEFLIQTGPYGKLQITDNPLNVRCLNEIMHSAYLLETHFPNVSFQIDGNINNCSSLNRGVEEMIKNKSRVAQNINKFNSPMHTVFLTTQTKFNHFLLGKMGLYINVNRSNEITHRLIEFRVGHSDIVHETKNL